MTNYGILERNIRNIRDFSTICFRNELFDRGMNKTPDGQNICDHCYEEMYDPRHYGPPPGNYFLFIIYLGPRQTSGPRVTDFLKCREGNWVSYRSGEHRTIVVFKKYSISCLRKPSAV